ncbi:hypothetical protein GCM10027578_18970 [Spirosoma luteolum]
MFANKTLWIILLIAWMAGSTWWHVCRIKQLCADVAAPATTSVDGSVAAPLTISDGDRLRLELPGNFSYATSGNQANLTALGTSLSELVTYLKANPGRTMAITGYYAASEAKPADFDNLGLARAEGIRQYLIQQGVPAASLTTQGQLVDVPDANLAFTPQGDSLTGGLSFAFGAGSPDSAATAMTPAVDTVAKAPAQPLPTTEAGLAAAEKFTSVFKPIDLYFPLGGANYIQTADTKKFFEEANRYLATHKDKKLLLTGHTDSSGPDAVNLRLSRERANDVKLKLRKSGIDPVQIQVDAKGETAPKADNRTPAGRRANRRVTVVVQ